MASLQLQSQSLSPIVVVPLRPEDVPQDFVCSVCLSVPVRPMITRECHHVFCTDCIHRCLRHKPKSCPVCRTELSAPVVAPMCTASPLAHRIWAAIGVKCQHHDEGCGWTGSLADYEAHVTDRCETHKSRNFRTDRTIKMYKEIIQKLRETVEGLRAEAADKDKTIRGLEQKLANEQRQQQQRRRHQHHYTPSSLAEMRLRRSSEELVLWEETAETMRNELDQLKRVVADTIETPWTNGRGAYAYDKHNVVRLTKLVCQNLERKPASIDGNKIFDCIHRIALDLRRRSPSSPLSLSSTTGSTDRHPAHFYIDVRMLVCVCLASRTWFTPNQMARIRELSFENGWC